MENTRSRARARRQREKGRPWWAFWVGVIVLAIVCGLWVSAREGDMARGEGRRRVEGVLAAMAEARALRAAGNRADALAKMETALAGLDEDEATRALAARHRVAAELAALLLGGEEPTADEVARAFGLLTQAWEAGDDEADRAGIARELGLAEAYRQNYAVASAWFDKALELGGEDPQLKKVREVTARMAAMAGKR